MLGGCGGTGGEEAAPTASTTTTISAEQLAMAQAVGDIAAGEELYNTPVEGLPMSASCATCHTLNGVDGRSPSLARIGQVAGERVEGLSDIEYLRQSIIDPAAFQTRDWPATMPSQYGDLLSEDQVDDLIAFLLTR